MENARALLKLDQAKAVGAVVGALGDPDAAKQMMRDMDDDLYKRR